MYRRTHIHAYTGTRNVFFWFKYFLLHQLQVTQAGTTYIMYIMSYTISEGPMFYLSKLNCMKMYLEQCPHSLIDIYINVWNELQAYAWAGFQIGVCVELSFAIKFVWREFSLYYTEILFVRRVILWQSVRRTKVMSSLLQTRNFKPPCVLVTIWLLLNLSRSVQNTDVLAHTISK